MDLSQAIILNIVAVLAICSLVFFVGGNNLADRAEAAFISLILLLQVTLLGWIIYVAVHFIAKYW